jgi:lysophospholipase
VSPVAARSSFCETCFEQYCFDPNSPPSSSELPGRKQAFVNPDPEGVSKVTTFLEKDKFPLIGGLIALIAVIAALVAFL